jgi:hypothetical protein
MRNVACSNRLPEQAMRHQHYATAEIYVEEVQRLLERTEDAVMQI